MIRQFLIASMSALAVCASGCGSPSPSAPASVTTTTTAVPTAPIAGSLTGTWTGMAEDSQGATRMTWVLAQTGSTVSGTVKTQAIDPTDGSCGSCHRNKSGTFSGTIGGDTVALTMFFAAGVDGDPTPACTSTLTGSASATALEQLVTTYAGSDSCEGAFENGHLSMARGR